MNDNRKHWLEKEDQLRGMLATKSRFAEGMALFLEQHAAVHSGAVCANTPWSLHDEVLHGLNDEQICHVARPGQNSIAWVLWHITRIEDMTINLLTLEQQQAWDDAWAGRLGISSADCGASMDADEVAQLSTHISVPALLAYRDAVGRRTRESIQQLSHETAKQIVPNVRVQQLLQNGSIGPKAIWLYEYYLKRTRAFFLIRTATSHNFHHLYEAGRIKSRLIKIRPARD